MDASGKTCQNKDDGETCQYEDDGETCQYKDEPALSDVVVSQQQAALHEAFKEYNHRCFFNVLPHTSSSVRLVFYDGISNQKVYERAFEVTYIPEGLVDESGVEPGSTR